MRCFLVSHTHWDREWYRTYQAFRARLVDAVDSILDRIAADPGFRFHLDGQTIVLEDYCEIRPSRRQELERACRDGRLGIGPWYVQPDSLLPSGETHVRNLLEGRRVGSAFGPVSRVAYTPDSFGHPAQFPQIFAGFGLEPFIYWRGNGDEIDGLPAEYRWQSPDGSEVLAHHLWEGYFNAGDLPDDAEAAAAWLERVARALAERSRNDCVLLLNGGDHAQPCAHIDAIAAALEKRTGWAVRRALLDDFAAAISADAPTWRGELLGGRAAPLLSGVWSTRLSLKLRNRAAETALFVWAEPWAALGRRFGVADEQPALRSAWRTLLQNQAHDSICGCSQERVHAQMVPRYDAVDELAAETTRRVLERLAGLGPDRRTPWTDAIEVAVFNPSPHPRTDIVRFPLDPTTWFEFRHDEGGRSAALHPLLQANLTAEGYTADGGPARLLADRGTHRMHLMPEQTPRTVELVAQDVPAFGWKRVRLEPGPAADDAEDDGREIAVGAVAVAVADDGTLTLRCGSSEYSGLGAVEDIGDRGDTYDFDPVGGDHVRVESVSVRRLVHPSGLQSVTVHRRLGVPAGLGADRDGRAESWAPIDLETEVRLIPGVARADMVVRLDNRAVDHRLRLLFPSGTPVDTFRAATTFDVATRKTALPDASRWVHAASATFPQQGWVCANGLSVVAPGLPEAEVTPDGVIAITLVRSVGWLSRYDLRSRPQPAGPSLPTPGAQCPGRIEARLSLFVGCDPRVAQDAESGLWAVAAGDAPLLPAGLSLLEIEPREVLLSALKPAEVGGGIVVRLLNPTDEALIARVRLGFPVSRATDVRLDETPLKTSPPIDGGVLSVTVRPHALASVLLE